MALLRIQEIREMSTKEREQRLNELRADLMRTRTLLHTGGAVDNPSRSRNIKKTISRILTVMNEGKVKKQ
jgi:ribosomal protein L29